MLKPALLIIAGRIVGFTASFITPLILVRIFDLETFGTYKQWFLLYMTIMLVMQAGMSESLLYFLPLAGRDAGRFVMNSALFLALSGAGAALALIAGAGPLATWMNNPALLPLIPLLALYLFLMQSSVWLEIVMTARQSYRPAAIAYAASDVVRALFLIVPVLFFPSLQALLCGAVMFGALRLAYSLRYVRGEFGDGLKVDRACLMRQLAYALPLALYVTVGIAQENFHQYAVSSAFDARAFAIYSVGCLQIPLVDVVSTTICNVMMVGMAHELREGREAEVIGIWHETIRKLALLFLPLACLLLVTARDVIVTLFTDAYLASVPVFMVIAAGVVFTVVPIDALLRVYAKTRTLLAVNLARLAIIAVSIQWFMDSFGLVGAALVTILALGFGKVVGMCAAAKYWRTGLADVLPWRSLAGIGLAAAAAATPALLAGSGMQPGSLLRLTVMTSVYAGAYVAAVWVFGLLTGHERASLGEMLQRVYVFFPHRSLPKMS